MSLCKRCDIQIEWVNNKPMYNNASHSTDKCKTKPGYAWCPKCKDAFLKHDACEHYLAYGYTGESGEEFFIRLIKRNYKPGDNDNKFKRWG